MTLRFMPVYAHHSGAERYERRFELDNQDDRYDIQGQYSKVTFRPQFVQLTWERPLGGPWRPVATCYRGSAIYGPRVLKTGLSDKKTGEAPVWASLYTEDRLTPYAESLPGVAELIDKIIENDLPK